MSEPKVSLSLPVFLPFFSIWGVSIFIIFVVLPILCVYWKYSIFRKRGNFPGLPPEFLFGSLRQTGVISGTGTISSAVVEWRKKYGDIFEFFLSKSRIIYVCRPELARQIFTNIRKYEMASITQDNFRYLFEKGLINLNGADHKRHSRIIHPMLKRGNVLPFLTHMVDRTDKVAHQWRSRCAAGGSSFETNKVFEDFAALTLEIMGFIVFDTDSVGLIDETVGVQLTSDQLRTNLRSHLWNLINFYDSLLMSPLPSRIAALFIRMRPSYRRSMNFVSQYVDKMIAHYKEEMENFNATKREGEEREFVPRGGKTLISVLIANLQRDEAAELLKPEEERRGLTREEVLGELTILVYASFETTSTLLSWFVYFVSTHPEVQQNLKEEMRRLGYDRHTDLDADKLNELKYADAVLKETLRLAPTAAGVSREATGEDVIEGYKVTKGDTIAAAFYSMHVDPRYWKIDPTKYVPERFYSIDGKMGEDANHDPYAYLPFGASHRACAGQELAKVELKAIICRLMQHVTISATDGMTVKHVQRITVIPMDFRVRVEFDE